MYLSRIAIDPNNRNTLRALDNPEIMHGMVESCFTGERKRTIWRLDYLNDDLFLLLLSHDRPDFTHLASQIGFAGKSGETKDYSVLFPKIKEGTSWRFRLTANPVTSIPDAEGKRGKKKAITITIYQREWLARQGNQHGFVLLPDQYDVVHSEWRQFRNKGRTISVLCAAFEGVLTVTDSEKFIKALKEGIGRAKAYGMGLLTVMKNE